MNGRQFLAVLRSLPAEALQLDVGTLVELYDEPRCSDCGKHHGSPWEALVCDELLSARRRRYASRIRRQTIDTL